MPAATPKEDEAVDDQRVGGLGIVLYSAPSTSQFLLGLRLAESALGQGYDVDLFAWGDAVYATTTSYEKGSGETNPAVQLEGLIAAYRGEKPRLTVNICTSCYKTRGLTDRDVMAGAHLSGMHRVVEMFQKCDRTLVMVP